MGTTAEMQTRQNFQGETPSQDLKAVRWRAEFKRRIAPWALLSPAALFLGVLIFASLMILRVSFGEKGMEWQAWTLQNYATIAHPLYLKSILLTFRLAFFSAIIVLILGYPLAMFMARTRSNIIRLAMTFIVLLPLFLNLLFQSYGWLIILSPVGLLNQLLMGLGLTNRPILFLFNETGVLIGLVQTSFPLAVLPMVSSLRTIPKSLPEAATTLGANRLKVFWHVVFPLSLPGVIGGTLLVFAFNASAFVIPFLLGGRRVSMLAVLIRDQMGPLLNWPFGSANAVILVFITLTVLAVYQYATRRVSKL
jgi:putative spermidine/putrescine transport system permease protein